MEHLAQKRDPYWDNIKGVLIILVVFAHCLYGLTEKPINAVIVKYIYFFHMPAFVFVSGYFSKGEKSRSKESMAKLAVAYMAVMAPFMVRAFVIGDEIPFITPTYSAWYLMALIGWRLIVPEIARHKHALLAAVIVSVLIGFWPEVGGCKVLAINRIVTFFPFFLAGYLMPEEFVRKHFTDRKPLERIPWGAAALAAGSAIIFACLSFGDIKMKNLLPLAYSSFGIAEPAIRIAAIAVSVLMIASLMLLCPKKKLPWLSKIGRNTLSIYACHRIFTLFYYKWEMVQGLQARYQILGAVLLTIAILVLFGSEHFSRLFYAFLNNCTDVVTGRESRYSGAYRAVMAAWLILLLLAPVLQEIAV